ncbi:hypothetical protein HPB49_003428 [Dermacentor silvarum]|uniref:Uncharacterized protein n=1 Tax=Dermacentor silvarum TaxID=543639 RepID=A0ACB8DAS9_DERSI|nr:hypothetical protein HPB49_003428 [Dermacentor silvarum]
MVGFLVFAILPTWEGLDFLFDSLGSYLRTSRLSKLRLCFYPNLGITMAVRIIAVFRDFSGKVDWDIVGKKALKLDNVTLLEIWLAMLAANVLMMFLIWYLPQVLPWATASPEHPLFCISKIHGKTVLNAVDLNLYVSQVTVVAGPSGAGKTALLKILAGGPDITASPGPWHLAGRIGSVDERPVKLAQG